MGMMEKIAGILGCDEKKDEIERQAAASLKAVKIKRPKSG